jgi:hypothetical protein
MRNPTRPSKQTLFVQTEEGALELETNMRNSLASSRILVLIS